MADFTKALVTDHMVLFWKPPCCFSQWAACKFTVDGETYQTAEQFMMAEKARLFGDEQVRRKIMETEDPREQKRLGRLVANFDEKVWVENRLPIVIRGNIEKFDQNPEMLQQLFNTGDKTLVEASPLDRIWGIGMSATNKSALNEKEWKGQNLLGTALMAARDHLRAKSA